LQSDARIILELSKDLGHTRYGGKVLGCTSFSPTRIFIDKSLWNDGRLKFTLAHELGHVAFHGRVDIAGCGYADQEIADTEHDLVTGKKILRTSRDWLEWQANRFASCLLMPRDTVKRAVIKVQKELGINRRLGFIYLDGKAYSMEDFLRVKVRLMLLYDVNSTVVECRLKDLRILEDQRNRDVKHISELLSTGPVAHPLGGFLSSNTGNKISGFSFARPGGLPRNADLPRRL